MNGRTIRTDGSGLLQLDPGDGPRAVDFNTLYKGYYPECGFTAAADTGGIFYAAGTDGNGIIRLFSSISGEAWTEINTQPVKQAAQTQSHGNVIAVLPGAAPDELLLVLRKGWCLYIPDCPRCVELIRLTEEEIRSAGSESGTLCCVTESGGTVRFSLSDLPRLRVDWAWAERHHALLFDLRTDPVPPVPRMASIPPDRWPQLREALPRDTWFALIADTGRAAEQLAKEARAAGWPNCRAMGTAQDALFAE